MYAVPQSRSKSQQMFEAVSSMKKLECGMCVSCTVGGRNEEGRRVGATRYLNYVGSEIGTAVLVLHLFLR